MLISVNTFMALVYVFELTWLFWNAMKMDIFQIFVKEISNSKGLVKNRSAFV